MLSVKSHNTADFILGAAFLVAPYLLGFSGMYFAHDVFTVLGFAVLGYSLLTDYSRSLIKAIPFSMHMTFDVVVGVFAILAPWIYGYRDELTTPQMVAHWAIGLATIATAFMTEREHLAVSTPTTTTTPDAEAEEASRREQRWRRAA